MNTINTDEHEERLALRRQIDSLTVENKKLSSTIDEAKRQNLVQLRLFIAEKGEFIQERGQRELLLDNLKSRIAEISEKFGDAEKKIVEAEKKIVELAIDFERSNQREYLLQGRLRAALARYNAAETTRQIDDAANRLEADSGTPASRQNKVPI